MRELYEKYFYNKLNKILLFIVIISFMSLIIRGRSVILFDWVITFFLPISYYRTFCKNKTIEDIVPVGSKEKFKRNFIVWSVLFGSYLMICFMVLFKYTNGEAEFLHNWFIQVSSAICTSMAIVAGAIAKRKYRANYTTVFIVGITMAMILSGGGSLVILIMNNIIADNVIQIVLDIFRVAVISMAIRYSFKNINEIKF